MKKNNKKGFTLAELLIVVAIIAVLVAVAIPVFNSQLEKAAAAADAANIRAAYAQLMVKELDPSDTSISVDTFVAKGDYNASKWSGWGITLPGSPTSITFNKGQTVTVAKDGTSYKVTGSGS